MKPCPDAATRLPSHPGRARWLAIVLLVACPVLRLAAAERIVQLKAAVVYNVTKFVNWPSSAFASPDAPLVIATIDQGPLSAELARVVEGRRLGSHKYEVHPLSEVSDFRHLHLLFVGEAPAEQIATSIAALENAPVLIVGDAPPKPGLEATIQLLVVNDKVAFDIDMRRADAAGLQVSAQLLKLARTVRRVGR